MVAKISPKKKPLRDAQLQNIVESLRPLAVAIADLKVDQSNVRKHSPRNIAAIKGSLHRYKQRKPIIVNSNTNTVEAGNGTLLAAVELGWKYIAVVFVQDDPTTATGYAISDNRTAELAEWDNEALSKMLADWYKSEPDVGDLYHELFNAAEIADLMKQDGGGKNVFDASKMPDTPETPPEDSAFIIYVTFKTRELFLEGLKKLSFGARESAPEGSRLAVIEGSLFLEGKPPKKAEPKPKSKAKEKA